MWVNHGTSVLGIVAGVDNDKGIVGIAPHTSVRVVSQWFEPAGQEPFFETAIALALAMAEMQKGDILLIETTAPPVAKFGWVPAEVDPLVFDLIKTATGRRVFVCRRRGMEVRSAAARRRRKSLLLLADEGFALANNIQVRPISTRSSCHPNL
jgi:hypothetical protein